LKKITLTFPAPLDQTILYQNENVTQEEILYTDLEGVRTKLKKELRKITRGIDILRKVGLDFFLVLDMRVEGIVIQMDGMMAWKRDAANPCIYYIYYPMDAASLASLRDVGSKFRLFGLENALKGKDLEFARIFREREFLEALRKFSFVEMKIDPDSVKIETTEVDGFSKEEELYDKPASDS
jgi:hypothetical protein